MKKLGSQTFSIAGAIVTVGVCALPMTALATDLPPLTNFDTGKTLRATDLKALLQNVIDIKNSLISLPTGPTTNSGSSLKVGGLTVFTTESKDGVNYAFGSPGNFDKKIGSQPISDFRYDADLQKLYLRSAFLTEQGDTPELGIRRYNGGQSSPVSLSKNDIIGLIYFQPLGTNGDFNSSTFSSPYYGRSAEILGRVTETPTGTARGGALVFGTTLNGSVLTRERAWISNKGWLVLGSAGPVQESGTNYDSSNTEGWGSLSIIANDQSTAPAIALRDSNNISSGIDLSYDSGTGNYLFNIVGGSGAGLSAVITPSGNWAFDDAVGIGTSQPTARLDVNGSVKGTSLCVGSTCINETQLKAILKAIGQ